MKQILRFVFIGGPNLLGQSLQFARGISCLCVTAELYLNISSTIPNHFNCECQEVPLRSSSSMFLYIQVKYYLLMILKNKVGFQDTVYLHCEQFVQRPDHHKQKQVFFESAKQHQSQEVDLSCIRTVFQMILLTSCVTFSIYYIKRRDKKRRKCIVSQLSNFQVVVLRFEKED